MDVSVYNPTVQGWMQSVLANRETDAGLVLARCADILTYGKETEDPHLIGFAKFYEGTVYYGLNDGAHFFDAMTEALTWLDRAGEGELVVRCYNYLGIGAMARGNLPIAFDYYLNGIKDADHYELPMCKAMLLINIGLLYMECGHSQDAEDAYRQVYELLQQNQDNEEYGIYLFSYYGNQADCFVRQGRLKEAGECLAYLHTHLWESADVLDRIFVSCVEVLYYHEKGEKDKCLDCVRLINETIPDNLTVLDIFNDFYRCCLVLLEMGQDELFWRIIHVIEPQVESFKVLHLHLKLLSLKMNYYRGHGQKEDYLKSAAQYYEMSERNADETANMLSNLITLRKNLENMKRARVRAERKNVLLQERSEQDPLTHLANRFRLNPYVEELYARALEEKTPIAVEILDIDYFKEYNDNYGHQAGDRCLQRVAETIASTAEENGDFCARFGGDEFVIVSENKTREQIVGCMEELRRRVMTLEIEHRYSKALPVVTISQGACWGFPQEEMRQRDFLKRADQFLYCVKKQSRNNYCIGGLEENGDETMGSPL